MGANEKIAVFIKQEPMLEQVFNSLTLEVVKMFKTLLYFRSYKINMKKKEQDTISANKDLFTIIQCLVTILELVKNFPETRKMLVEKRKETSTNKITQNIIMDQLNIFNMFKMEEEEEDHFKQKPKYSQFN